MKTRVRYYTYKVTFIDQNDFTDGTKTPLFIDYVPMKRNAAEARREVAAKTTRPLIFLSTIRAKHRQTNNISSVQVVDLTKRHIHTVEKVKASVSLPVAAAPSLTFTAPASTVVDTTTVSSSGTVNFPLNLVIVPPGPVTEAPAYDPQTELRPGMFTVSDDVDWNDEDKEVNDKKVLSGWIKIGLPLVVLLGIIVGLTVAYFWSGGVQ